jgi:hypothetical protein
MRRLTILKFMARAGTVCLLLVLVFLFLGRTVTEPCDPSPIRSLCDPNETRWEWAMYVAGVALVLAVLLFVVAGFLAWRSRGESPSMEDDVSAGRGSP